ncbi:MAG TPA: S41 family peptidase [Pyrinomonadaceae bacterium]|nr:S41 family peptidase [Pyrinomonadaceae bacterium]
MTHIAPMILRALPFILCLPGLAAPTRVKAQGSKTAGLLSGRWELAVHLPDGIYETPVEFQVQRNGEVTWSVLGQLGDFSIAATSGRLEGDHLTLLATTSFGQLKVTAVVEGDRLEGKWFPAGFLSQLFFAGEVRGRRAALKPSTTPRVEIFDAVWTQVRRDFYASNFNGVDWEAARRRYRPLAASARSDGELLSVVRRMLGELRASHLEFFAVTNGLTELPTPRPGATGAHRTFGISWKKLTPAAGYLRIERFEDGAGALARIDGAFAELGALPSLVIDLRGNGGGALTAAMRVGDYIFKEPRRLGYFASRDGLARRGVASIDQLAPDSLQDFSGYESEAFNREMRRAGALMLATGGRAKSAYQGRVVVLIDEYCYSASEAFAGVVKEMRAATLIGRRTAGAMLGADVFPIAGGWMLVLPVWDFRTAGGVRVEGVGVEPDIKVKFTEKTDADLSEALRFLMAAAPAISPSK